MMGPAMPTGLVLDDRHWSALADACERHDAWLIYDAAMERIRFDGRPPSHPAGRDELFARTITVGSASKELRLIGWRVGWVTGPAPHPGRHPAGRHDQRRLPGRPGPARGGRRAGRPGRRRRRGRRHRAAGSARCEVVLRELSDYPVIAPHGGWSLLVDTRPLGLHAG